MDAAEAGRMVRQRLETDGHHCLLVFDNATDPQDLLPFIPSAGHARVLITSNERSMADLGTGIAVDVFTEEEALAFLADRTGSTDADGARLVARELGCLPLALAQAAAVIATQHLDYLSYLQRLRDMPVDQLLTRVRSDRYPHGLAAAVLLSLDAVAAGDDAGICSAVVELVSVLSAGGVSRKLLHLAGQVGALTRPKNETPITPQAIDEMLGQLAGSSLLTFSVDGRTVTAHRLVMRVIRERMARHRRLASTSKAVAEVLEAQAESLSQEWQDRAARRDLIEQILALYEHSASCLDEADGELTQATLRLRRRAVVFLHGLGDRAAQVIQVAGPLVSDQERVLGPDHPDTLDSRSNLAAAYRSTGRVAEAISMHEQTLADRERILGSDHPDTLISRNNLAMVYRDVGRVTEAIPLHEQVLADRERILGPDHPDTLISRSNLAMDYRGVGQMAEAISLHEQVLADRERILGPDHPRTLTSRHALAVAYRDAGRVPEAIPLNEQTLADRERILGPHHRDTLMSRNSLALTYQAAEGIALHEQVLAARERILGPDHPKTVESRNILARARVAAGEQGAHRNRPTVT